LQLILIEILKGLRRSVGWLAKAVRNVVLMQCKNTSQLHGNARLVEYLNGFKGSIDIALVDGEENIVDCLFCHVLFMPFRHSTGKGTPRDLFA
jgi:hypothetical protein